MHSKNRTARIAGTLYLLLILTGIFSILYVPSQLIDWKDAERTVSNITESEVLFRLSLVTEIICYTIFLPLVLVLYRLFKQTHRDSAILMVLLVSLSIPISFSAVAHKFDALTILIGPDYIASQERIPFHVMYAFESYANGIHVAEIFWGLWLLPFGYLVYKCGFLPKALGIFLMLGCIGYLIEFMGSTLSINYSGSLLATVVGLPSSVGEFGICLWLLIMGTNKFKSGTHE